jgi:hypothetical protein
MVVLMSDPFIAAVYILGAASQFPTWQDLPVVIVSPGDELNLSHLQFLLTEATGGLF